MERGYSVSINQASKELTKQEKIKFKDTTDCVRLDEATKNGEVIINPDFYAVLDVHNEKAQSDKDYRQYVIVDEAQNLTPHEVKTIVSRCGDDTKMILTGDPRQIDNPYLDSSSNGLSYAVEKMKGQPVFGHVTLAKSERGKLAALAADLL